MLDGYSVILNIEIETYRKYEGLLNKFVEPGIKIKSISIDNIEKFLDDEIVKVTEKELDTICYKGKEITLIEQKSDYHKGYMESFHTKNKGFTVKDMFNIIVEFEKKARPLSIWFGGIDAHHVYFEGLTQVSDKKNTFTICWGS